MAAFEAAGWTFQGGRDLDWRGVPGYFGGPVSPGLLTRHPSGGLVILRDRLALQFRPWVETGKITERLQRYLFVRDLNLGGRVFEVALALPEEDLEEHIRRELDSLRDDDEVVFAEPSLLYHLEAQTDELDGDYDTWHWKQVELPAAWALGEEKGKGKGIRIAIVDRGFHPDDCQLKPNVAWKVTLDQDGNIVKKMPEHPHGTMCAGLVGAILDESEVNGAAPLSELGLVALGDFQVCSQVALAIALRMCAELLDITDGVPKGKGADVISCSLGITESNWELGDCLREAIDGVLNQGRGGRGTPIAWATFNANKKIEAWAVEGYDPLLVASRSDFKDRRVVSGWGKGLDLLAPGHAVSVISWDSDDRFIKYESGSSLAAPSVAGVAALVLAVNSNLTSKEVAEVITRSCDPVGKASVPNEEVGWGRLNAKKAVEKALNLLASRGKQDDRGLLEQSTI